MAKYTGSDCRLCRREGCKLFLKGDRCYTQKCSFERRAKVPGQHGMGRKKVSEYGLQLREKQKAKRYYGLSESQFKKYYDIAERTKGVTGDTMLCLLERRLDNVVFKLGLGSSRAQARQIVNHGHITVNGKRVNIPSYLIKAGDVVAVKENRKGSALFKELPNKNIAKWLEFDSEKLAGKVVTLPQREDVELDIAEHMIVELYSK